MRSRISTPCDRVGVVGWSAGRGVQFLTALDHEGVNLREHTGSAEGKAEFAMMMRRFQERQAAKRKAREQAAAAAAEEK